ncbi:immunoglobulin-like domain-containing protein, partial [Uliginosibacterium paludis]|uniref:immunoglobulin-like domain-containing protein n=1 Tax=Uliginosibacterium paludis TaxID=1615952 RepID=UPI0031F6BB9E
SVAQTDVTVTLTYSGTAAKGTDFTGTTTVTIPAGSSSASFSIPALADGAVEGTEHLTVSIGGASGGSFEHLAISTSAGSVTTQIADADTATVSLSATSAITEAGGNIVYTATITSAPVSDLTVTLDNGRTITIAAGSTTGSVTVAVAASDDVYLDASSTQAAITGVSGGGINASFNPAAAVTTIADTIDTTSATLTASASVAEGSSITYTVTLASVVTGSDVTVKLVNGETITIPVGSSSGSVTTATADNAYTGSSVVTNHIDTISGGNFESLVADKTAVTTTVTDEATPDATTVTLTASATAVTEGGSVVYTASVDHPVTGSPLVISLSNGQSITIPVGSSSASSAAYAVRADDVYAQGDAALNVSITGTAGGQYEALTTTSSVSTTVSDDTDITSATLTASSSVAEGSTITYTVTLASVVT